jgi:hypothetical protein
MVRALRRDKADLGQMAAQSIERRRALAGEQLARPMAHQLSRRTRPTHHPRLYDDRPSVAWASGTLSRISQGRPMSSIH